MAKKKFKEDQFAAREAQKYANPIVSREFILETLEEHGRPITLKKLLKELQITDAEQEEALRRRLQAMVRDGQLLQNRRHAYGLIEKMELIKGYVIGHKDGFGFLVPEAGGDDLFLNARQMRAVFPDDEVLVRVGGMDYRGRREAIIVEVLERKTHQLVGRLVEDEGVAYLEPSNQRIAQTILIADAAKNKALHGQIVIVEIIEQPTAHKRAVGKVIEVLGDHMAPGMEIDIAIRNHELPHEWPEAALKQAKQFQPVVPESAFQNRLDLRHLAFVTIDGEDAKDFDDAVYCEKVSRGGWELYVAIADVSHYVLPNTPLDKEAFNRGNSVYFPGQVIPMLPEVLSNELCSLKPQVNRLTMICKMTITHSGKIANYQFFEGVICSFARLTYNQVYNMVEKGEVIPEYQNLLPYLKELFAIYHVLHTARLKRGAIDFDLPEPKIIFGEGRKIERIIALERNDAHRMIEECMLAANICTARFLIKSHCAGLFRTHEGPSLAKLTDLRKFLQELGLTLPGGEKPTPGDYATLLKKVAGRPDAHLIQTVLLRSLSQAIYSKENNGHFGLAYDAYTHFTSPIRRYPDLIVHRAIRKILQNKVVPDEDDPLLDKYGEHCSMTERRADDATREAIDWLKCEYMQDKVGDVFMGVITSVTGFGLFVELSEIYVEGLVHISMLRNDYYQFDPVKHALLGEHSGKRYRLGDVVKVKVARVDLDQRQIDFVIEEEMVATRVKRPNKKKQRL